MTSGSAIMHAVQSKPRRGRKQDDSLPPSRARDVQRAFRARRAAHLNNLEARNIWLEQENAELRKRLGMAEDDPPLSGPEPELQVVASPGGSSKGEETLIKNEDGSPPPVFSWDEHGETKGKEKARDQDFSASYQGQEVQSWNARRIEGNALGFDPANGSSSPWDARSNGVTPLPPLQQQQQQQHGFQIAPPIHPPYEHNPLAYLASLPMNGFGPPPPHHSGSNNFDSYPYAWTGPPRHAQLPQTGQTSPSAVYPHSF